MSITEKKIQVIQRDSIESLTSITVDGKNYNLGLHKDFRKDNYLKDFLPENCRLSLAWVHLKNGETLETHEHPIETMIIMCKGTGKMHGDLEKDIAEGDVIVIPRESKHGFTGTGENGYWALSVQLEQRGLYEIQSDAMVGFQNDSYINPILQTFIKKNESYMEKHVENPLFKLVLSGKMKDKAIRSKLLDTIQVWSNIFQHVVMSRLILTSDDYYRPLALDHLLEEFGHNRNLEKSRNGTLVKIFDPILQATSEWFAYKMQSYSDIERLVLVHFVLEGGAKVFHEMAHPIMQSYDETSHFEVHSLEDDGHMQMGLELMKNLSQETYDRLNQVLEEGWGMLNALCQRMAELSLTKDLENDQKLALSS